MSAAATCARCGKPVVARYRPFCSRRCADIDLSRWLNGAYAIPAHTPPDDAEIAAARGETGEDGTDPTRR